MVSIFLAIISLGLLIIIHEGGHFLVARMSGMRVDRFSIGFGPALFKFTRGETTYQVGIIPLGGFVQIAGLNPNEEGMLADDPRSYPKRPVYQRFLTIAAGPGTNYLFAALWMGFVFSVFGEPGEGKLPVIDDLTTGLPAAAAGIQMGDEVISIDGKLVKRTEDVKPIIEASAGKPVSVLVMRAGSERTYQITPAPSDGGWRIGVVIAPRHEWIPVPRGQAFLDGVLFPFRTTPIILHELGKLVKEFSFKRMSGPVGMIGQMRQNIKHGWADGLATIGAISVGLGLFNLLPLPALDGGRLFFLLYEGVSRRRFPQLLEQRIHMVGILALLGLLLIITAYDISRLVH